MFPGNWNVAIADLGTIQAGESIEDTYFLVKSVSEDLLRKQIIPIIIGGSQDLTYAMYRAYDNLDQLVNLTSIDSQI
jgi:arginase family enzyme